MPATAAAVYLHVDELRPNPRNPRVHGADVERLARTILRTTWGAPILARASDRRIIGGHGRLEAAKLILRGLTVDGEARGGPGHRFDPDAPGPGMVPVRLLNVSDAEADALTLADNARALQGTDDVDALVAMARVALDGFGDLRVDLGMVDAAATAAGIAASGAVTASPPRASPALPLPANPGAPARGIGPEGREYDEGVEDEVDTLTCPHCGGKVPRG